MLCLTAFEFGFIFEHMFPMKQSLIAVALVCVTMHACVFEGPDQEKNNQDSTLVSTDIFPAKDSLRKDSVILIIDTVKTDSVFVPASKVNTKNVDPKRVVEFAKTLIGVPYKYASTDPKAGFDCSGFITYVFTHFNIIVPRSSIDFTHVGRAIDADEAKPGDLILFTGTDSTEKFVGHMGLVVSNQNKPLEFIHSTSGKKYGVTITALNDYYLSRYVKTIRIFPQNDK